jgi:hypothetical protein
MTTMIRIERGAEVGPGIWEYHAPAYPSVCGKSRQPLLDACRQLKSILGEPPVRVGVFRDGSEVADISCTLKAGAATMASETDRDGVRFVKFKNFDHLALSPPVKSPPQEDLLAQ